MVLSISRRRFLGSAAALAALPLTTRLAMAADALNFQASWINDAEFAGYFTALDNGYYKDEGLDVAYLSGGPDVIPESTLIAGKADITLTTPDTTIQAISTQGAPFKIIGAQYQKNPLGIVSLAKNSIKAPADLVGKTVAVPPVNVVSFDAMLKISGVDKDKVNVVPYEYDPTPLIKGDVDATLDFVTDVPFTIKQAGEEATSFLLYDHGFTIYNDTVVVSEDTLKTKRDLLVKWLRASRKGWVENFKDPAVYPAKFADSWMKGTGRSTDADIFLNTAEKPLMDNPAGIYAMTEEGIAANITALGLVGITATREMFDTTLLAEL
jgi:ABC-type nitrate/sulfonate/bicarbonate transport system substrate-binding protein